MRSPSRRSRFPVFIRQLAIDCSPAHGRQRRVSLDLLAPEPGSLFLRQLFQRSPQKVQRFFLVPSLPSRRSLRLTERSSRGFPLYLGHGLGVDPREVVQQPIRDRPVFFRRPGVFQGPVQHLQTDAGVAPSSQGVRVGCILAQAGLEILQGRPNRIHQQVRPAPVAARRRVLGVLPQRQRVHLERRRQLLRPGVNQAARLVRLRRRVPGRRQVAVQRLTGLDLLVQRQQ